MKEVLLYLWQLPQNLLGWILTRSRRCQLLYIIGIPVYFKLNFYRSGVSLGKYIILDKCNYGSVSAVKHEYGHQLQSKILGWFYLPLIGLPSFVFNILDRGLHKDWDFKKRTKWYYRLPWEAWADHLGDVHRSYKDKENK